ncbi:MAG: SpoIID/LytB domain-containing protein [bacterium]|nr:SpoIID/LytB domain-containing protein [bacterium]
MVKGIKKYTREPIVRVGIIERAPEAYFTISSPVELVPEKGVTVRLTPSGRDKWHIALFGSELQVQNIHTGELHRYPAKYIRVEPIEPQSAKIIVHDVTIGIQFHWQRKEDQTFPGVIEFRRNKDDTISVINELPIESYLQSVISSEMSGTSPIALLQAHTVIARSWLLAQMDNPPHIDFDVCADDHCQRYQGLKRMTATAVQAVNDTRGQVLTYQNTICDTRYSKSCGGISENFENVWQDTPFPYLSYIIDAPENEFQDWLKTIDGKKIQFGSNRKQIPDLTDEITVREWITHRPPAYCNASPEVLESLLNEYDREIPDLFRWKVVYPREELEQLIQQKTQEDIGTLLDLVPIKRGISGRLIYLDIVGSKKTLRIGKELKIRSALSPSHLYSSAFVVDVEKGNNGIPIQFTLLGAGWGHGVGLCQIGAAVMATKGFDYKTILFHYYLGTEISFLW